MLFTRFDRLSYHSKKWFILAIYLMGIGLVLMGFGLDPVGWIPTALTAFGLLVFGTGIGFRAHMVKRGEL